ncbi:hypothetical protein TNCV_5108561 [Trichonephila clavipes]|nr:hypothetical protein TNCV_5108561 [Trichonephila clavipes]
MYARATGSNTSEMQRYGKPPRIMIPGAGLVLRCISQQFSSLTAVVSLNSNPTIEMLQAGAGFVSKDNVVPIYYSCPPFIASLATQMPMVSSQG